MSSRHVVLLLTALTSSTIGCVAGDVEDDGTTTTQALDVNGEKLIDDLDLLPLEGAASSDDAVKTGPADGKPGTYHVLLTNFLGLKGQSFVEDRTMDDEVWSQPVTGYSIPNGEDGSLHELSCEAAVKILYADREEGDPKRAARLASSGSERCFDIKVIVERRDESGKDKKRRLHYILGAQADGRIVTGEWLGKSVTCHPGSCVKNKKKKD